MPDPTPIVRHRGDTFAFRITFSKADGGPLPLSGTVILVVSALSAPPADDTPVMSLAGTLIDSGDNGVVEFKPDATDADHVGRFFYDVQMTDSGGDVRTILSDDFILIQDRAK
jgi:hypothetical protein